MQIHLSKPGGQREGPFTLEQIVHDLAAHKYRDTDYWAWHEGLPEWVPLYALPGVSGTTEAAPGPAAPSEPEELITPAKPGLPPADAAVAAPSPAAPRPQPQPARPATPALAASAAPAGGAVESPAARTAPEPEPAAPGGPMEEAAAALASPAAEPEVEPAALGNKVASGMPAAALEQIFMFTTGDGPPAWQSSTVARMLKEIISEDFSTLRLDVARDVVARCSVDELLKPDGTLSEAVWRAMAAHRPALVQQARERLYRICVRTFRIEADTIVALVLFYNKQKL